MFRFASPYYFLLLFPLAAGAWFVYRRNARAGILFSATSRLAGLTGTWRTRTATLLPVLPLTGLLLAVLALARPQTVFSRIHRAADVIAIEMVVDVSGSMEALDLSERTAAGIKYRTRLDAVKTTFAEFVEKRPDDLIGLVAFGGFAATRAPLTTDHAALLHILGGIEIPQQAIDGQGQVLNQEELLTAIGDALATACARLENAEPVSRIIVLLSDGESNTGMIEPNEATELAKKMGLRVYTIGVGSSGMAPFWGKDMFGRKAIRQARVELDEAQLRKIATTTGGRYFNVKDPQGLEDALEEIDALEKTRVEQDIFSHYNELFAWFLLPGLCLAALGTGLNLVLSRRII